ncbi:MAG: FG-GAP repeat protein [Deltaproteobacteria bacterium]|nr:FG-GAP repeat protein [Deltaproteobacteria bacterium]
MRRVLALAAAFAAIFAYHVRSDSTAHPVSSGTGPMSIIGSTRVSAVDAPIAPASPGPDLIERAQSHLAQREYWASATDEGLQAPNRAHDLRSYFGARGVSVEDRDATERTPLVALSLVGLGRQASLSRVPAGEVVDVGEGRVEIRRASIGLVEWFENSSAGLEQGFTLLERPRLSSTKKPGVASRGAISPGIESPGIEPSAVEPTTGDDLVVELSISGAHATLAGDRVRLATASGRSLDYGKLVVVDANEIALASRFEVPSEDRVRIVVDDREATYPIVIDPLLTGSFDAVVESNQPGSEFGVSVASAGDVNGDGFDDVIVGATLYDLGETDEGAAFVFLGSPTGIGNGNPGTAHAVLQGNQALAGFGRSVAGAGDVNGDGYSDVVVGSYVYDAGQPDEGAAFVFHGSATGIASGGPTSANGSMESDQASGFLGFGIASAGDVNGDGYGDLIVGAHGYDAPEVDEGAAFVLLGGPTGIGNRNPTNANARLEGQQAGALLGLSVASAGDFDADGYSDVIVGAPYYDYIFPDTGSAYLFYGSASGIPNGDAESTPSAFAGDQSFSRFGYSVASAGDVNGDGYADVIIGASFQDNGQTDEGNAFLFHGSPTELSGGFFPTDANQRLESNQVLASFGTSVASAGDVNGDGYADVIVGAQFYDSGQIDEGLAFVYRGSASGIVPVAVPIQYDQASAVLGYSVASAGDVNGDGFDDVIAGAFIADVGQADEGAAFVFHGGAASIRDGRLTDASVEILQAFGSVPTLGFSVAAAGDVDADGYSDLVVGAPFYDAGQTDEGAVFIFRGTPTGIPSGSEASASTSLYSDQVNAVFGYQVASAGDVNGDGYGDIVAGAVQFDAGEVDEGAAFVFLGSATGIASGSVSTAHARLESNQAGAFMGSGVSSAGDVDGDGYGDVLVGAGLYDAGSLDEGAVFVFSGSAAGIANGSPSTADATLESNQASTTPGSPVFGTSISSAGDVNGDGFDDVVIGAAGYENGTHFEGAAFLFLGSASGIASGALSEADATFETDQPSSFLGLGVGSAGDVNGDGYSDIVLGARLFEFSIRYDIVAYVFHGGATGIPSGGPTTADGQLELQVTTTSYAINVGSAGDLNADGFADVLVAGSPTLFGDGGGVYAFLGSPSGVANATSASAHLSIEQLPASSNTYRTFVANAGDLNADGHPDLVVGSPRPGSLSVFLGNSQGRVVLARQFRGDGSGIAVQPGGSAYAADAFEASVFVRSAVGRERGKVELEACPVGSAFGAPACRNQISPSWVDLGTAGAEIRQVVTGLAPDRSYSWRARLLTIPYSSTQSAITPIVHRSPWFRVQARANTGDLRTVPEPDGFVALLVASAVLIAARRERLRGRSGSSRAMGVDGDS